MRGSPLIRTLIVLITLLVAGIGLSALGSHRSVDEGNQATTPLAPEADPTSVTSPFVLTLSAPAQSVAVESLGQTYSYDSSSQTISGSLPVELGHPTLFIDIEWADPQPSPRFAKLVLEPAGFATQTKIFDATGAISDVWELHLHHHDHE
ncbi:hypothetical protein ACFQY0_05450 [Haloferula chungangensis]|uniref:Uncharacterized protein n=1 Tax=Haloferula chungangensis TaxID=1048331 RepID=A0ABW2L2S7_9BACT